MALNIRIDFDNRYNIVSISDLQYSVFDAELANGETARLGIKISSEAHPFMNDVYNLSFGPLNEQYQIDDKARLTHRHHSKVFSTIVFECLSFLTQHPDKFLGIDGSNTARAYMYYRCIQNNFDYLTSYFVIYGVNYYMRILRDDDFEHGLDDFLVIPKIIEKGEAVLPGRLYNYFIFKVK